MVWQDERYRRDAVLALQEQAEIPLASRESSQSRGALSLHRVLQRLDLVQFSSHHGQEVEAARRTLAMYHASTMLNEESLLNILHFLHNSLYNQTTSPSYTFTIIFACLR